MAYIRPSMITRSRTDVARFAVLGALINSPDYAGYYTLGENIIVGPGGMSPAAVEAAWADSGITPTRHLALPSWEAVKLAVARGDGVAGCSEFTVERELRAGTLAVVRLPGWKVRRTISVVHHRETVLTPSAREFVAMLHARWGRSSARRRRDRHGPAAHDLSAALSSSARRRAP